MLIIYLIQSKIARKNEKVLGGMKCKINFSFLDKNSCSYMQENKSNMSFNDLRFIDYVRRIVRQFILDSCRFPANKYLA